MTAINKKIGTSLIICYFTVLGCVAQIDVIGKDYITVNQNNVLGMNIESFTSLFGTPSSSRNDYLEMSEKTTLIYEYNGGTFWFVDNSLYSFRIYGSEFSVFNINITVNQNINTTELLFPISFQNKSNNSLLVNIQEHDSYVIIEFNDFNLITSIEINSY